MKQIFLHSPARSTTKMSWLHGRNGRQGRLRRGSAEGAECALRCVVRRSTSHGAVFVGSGLWMPDTAAYRPVCAAPPAISDTANLRTYGNMPDMGRCPVLCTQGFAAAMGAVL